MGPEEFEAAMRELREDYVRTLPERVDEVEHAWAQASAGEWDATGYRTFIRLAHNLAGSGATYGVEPISRAARTLELYAKSLEGDGTPPEGACAEIQELILKLRGVMV
jgi:HPt (histidine-containing phosphotransfer) domain-containing protein